MNRPLVAASRQSVAPPARAWIRGSFEWQLALSWGATATVSFHLALIVPALSGLMVLFLFSLLQLTGIRSARHAFRCGVVIGFAVYAPHLAFFWSIFSWAAVALWGVIAFWLGLFVVLARAVRLRWGTVPAAVLVPFVWTGLEYFRSELYHLRFSWLSASFVFSETPRLFHLTGLGFYGVGFLLAAVAAGAAVLLWRTTTPNGWARLETLDGAVPGRPSGGFGLGATSGRALPRTPGGPWVAACLVLVAAVVVLGLMRLLPTDGTEVSPRPLKVAGVQLEFPAPIEVPGALDRARQAHPDAELFVLSEYTFLEPVPERVKAWCRANRSYLIAGGKEPAPNNQFFNTAFVIGPDGEVVFQQAKSVPIQFFQDGLPAPQREVWESPWGKIGICVCYDLSYRRVVDELIAQGAQALIVPTMDMTDWGEAQHRLHGRVAPIRAAEYRVPIFRLCSSGISQLVDANGHVQASAPFPGEGVVIGGTMNLGPAGRLPLDHYLAPVAAGVTGGITLILLVLTFKHRGSRNSVPTASQGSPGGGTPPEPTSSPEPESGAVVSPAHRQAPALERRAGLIRDRRDAGPTLVAARCAETIVGPDAVTPRGLPT